MHTHACTSYEDTNSSLYAVLVNLYFDICTGDIFVVSGASRFKVGHLDKFTISVHKSQPVSSEGGVAKRMHVSETVSPQEDVAKRMRKPEGGVGGPG